MMSPPPSKPARPHPTPRPTKPTTMERLAGTRQDDVTAALQAVQAARDAEANQSDDEVKREQQEDRARENQFRQEVAAAHEDPDTYAPGNPISPDPVLQVSVSVI